MDKSYCVFHVLPSPRMRGLPMQAGGCSMMSIWDDRHILALLLHVPFIPVTFLAVLYNSVTYRKSTTLKCQNDKI